MAENSLFAILLRSPWWISLALAAAIALAVFALLPRNIAPFGAVGAIPIAAIGVVAAVRQWKAPSAAQVERTLAAVSAQGWRDFCAGLEAGFARDGYAVSRLGGAGADLRLERRGRVALVSARRWKAASHGLEPLRELQAATEAAEAQEGIYVAAGGTFNDQARAYATLHGIGLFGAPELARLLR
ncbi:MAG: hypothetical protein GAK38_04409 [Xylophilus sp.]|nr:MAG: hypothetical protein GAK38_04409 [Xylophilus sp.]